MFFLVSSVIISSSCVQRDRTDEKVAILIFFPLDKVVGIFFAAQTGIIHLFVVDVSILPPPASVDTVACYDTTFNDHHGCIIHFSVCAWIERPALNSMRRLGYRVYSTRRQSFTLQ